MPSSWRRFEVLLPLQFNDGRDVPESLENRQWMKDYKDRWKSRLEQLELWLVSYLIEVDQRRTSRSTRPETSRRLLVAGDGAVRIELRNVQDEAVIFRRQVAGGCTVEVPVLIERFDANGYRATILGLDAASEAPTREGALDGLTRLLRDKLATAELVRLEVPSGEECHPWKPLVDRWRGHPDLDEVEQNMRDYRR